MKTYQELRRTQTNFLRTTKMVPARLDKLFLKGRLTINTPEKQELLDNIQSHQSESSYSVNTGRTTANSQYIDAETAPWLQKLGIELVDYPNDYQITIELNPNRFIYDGNESLITFLSHQILPLIDNTYIMRVDMNIDVPYDSHFIKFGKFDIKGLKTRTEQDGLHQSGIARYKKNDNSIYFYMYDKILERQDAPDNNSYINQTFTQKLSSVEQPYSRFELRLSGVKRLSRALKTHKHIFPDSWLDVTYKNGSERKRFNRGLKSRYAQLEQLLRELPYITDEIISNTKEH